MDQLETEDLIGRRPPPPEKHDTDAGRGLAGIVAEPLVWVRMLCRELNGTFVLGIFIVYGFSQGFTSSFFRVVVDYYWKDVQKVQPSEVQVFVGLYYIPWVMKPLWGFLTDIFPVAGYRRRPYFIAAGILGTLTTAILSTFGGLPVVGALLCLIGLSAAVAIAEVTIDACIAANSIRRPELATDMQSFCNFVSSIGALIGFLGSGVLVHLLGAQRALALMAVPEMLTVVLGCVIYEHRTGHQSAKVKAELKVNAAVRGMARTIRSPSVWKPSLYMFLSLALSISTHEGQFYWLTHPTAGPAFSQEFIGVVYAIGAMAAIVGVLIYHKLLKNYPFRSILFYAQLFYGISGMLDLIFVLRWKKLYIPAYFFVVLEECCSRIISKIRWIPMIVLSTKLCPQGIEGTFFALLTCIDSVGMLSSKTLGGVVLRAFHVTRDDFRNLWLVVLIRNLLRISTLGLIFLVPMADQTENLLPPELFKSSVFADDEDDESLQLAKVNMREDV